MIRKFWKPAVTSQFRVCPVPFHLDMYRGCVYNCRYCFARDFVTFYRRKRPVEEQSFSYLDGNRVDLFRKWIDRTLAKDYDYTKPEEVAFKERIPLKIGATSDPFPWVELKERITYGFLEALCWLDYPVEIQTKNPGVLAEYAKDFLGANWTIAVTLISMDADFLKVAEPRAPSPENRLCAIRKLVDMGYKVMVKIQPAVYPKILDDLPALVAAVADSGAWAINTEGLKVRVSMPKHEQVIFAKIGEYLGYDLRGYYKSEQKTSSDYELSDPKKLEYIKMAEELSESHGLRYFNADNHHYGRGCNSECCGTEVLRDYRIYGNNDRTLAFGELPLHSSTHFGRILCSSFGRSRANDGKTIDEAVEASRKREEKPPLLFDKKVRA